MEGGVILVLYGIYMDTMDRKMKHRSSWLTQNLNYKAWYAACVWAYEPIFYTVNAKSVKFVPTHWQLWNRVSTREGTIIGIVHAIIFSLE